MPLLPFFRIIIRSVFVSQNSTISIFDSDNSWTILSLIEQDIKLKIETIGTQLKDWGVNINYGVKTGYNEAFIIDKDKKDELIASDPKSAEIIRPILRGRDIKRYRYEFANLWLIVTHNGNKEHNIPRVDIDTYPAIKTHLDSYYTNLVKRADKGDTPYNLRNCVYMDDLDRQKIIWGEISDKPKFIIDLEGTFYPEATTFLMTGNHLKYLLCFLNSTLSEYFFAKYGTTTGMGTLRWKKYLIELLPVPSAPPEIEKELETLLDKLSVSYNDEYNIIKKIDSLVYRLFDLSNDEIEFIEKTVKTGAH